MPVTPSKTFMNFGLVTFTPDGGTAIVIDQVVDIQDGSRDTLERWKADGGRFCTQMVQADAERSITITSGNIAIMRTVPIGTAGILTFQVLDSHNGATVGGGGILVTMSKAIRSAAPFKATQGKFATGTITFMGISPDGITDPLSAEPL